MDLTKFNAVEVTPVTREIIDDRDCFEMCAPDDPDLFCWGVYLRHVEGHVHHVADCATKEIAEIVARGLEKLI
jgi:hypothetical protein